MNFRIGKYEIAIGKYYVPQGKDKYIRDEYYMHVMNKTLKAGPMSSREVDKLLKESNQHVGARAAIDIRKDMERYGVIEHYRDLENKKYMVKLRTS